MPTDEEVTQQLPAKYVRGAQPNNRNAEKHGSHAARRDIRELTRRIEDRRTSEYREWNERRSLYLAHLGGEGSLSAMELRSLDEMIRAEMRVDWLDAWLDAHQLVYGRGRKAAVVPVLRDHMGQSELARRLRIDLGLRRRLKDANTLDAECAAAVSGTGHQAAPEAAHATQDSGDDAA